MSGRQLSVLIVCILFLPSLLPVVSMENRAVGASGITATDRGPIDRAITQSTEGRSNLETAFGGGSWTEYFTQNSTASDNRTWAVDGKLQLDTDFTSLTKWVNDPVILPSVGHFDSSGTRMNSMLFENGTFKVWYGGTDGTHWKIGYATSMDGINWTKQNGGNPVLNLGAGGTWDSNHVSHPIVINDAGTYKMWFCGHDGSTWQVGYATSSDGISWNKNANNPVMKVKGGTFYSSGVYTGSVIKENGIYKMWMVGYIGGGNAGIRIGYATSNNGIAWNINANTILALGVGGSFDSTANNAPNVWRAGNRYFMTYSGYDGNTMQIGAAESLDGLNWKIMNNDNPIIKKGAGGSWDSTYMIETSRVQLGYRTYFLYGAYNTIWQIGLALADTFFTEGYAYSQKIDLPKGMVWDNVSLKKAEPTGTSIKISVVDPSTNKSLAGFDNKTASDLNLSSIDSSAHKSLRLIAYFKGTTSTTPSLYMWGVSWRNMTTWRDTFIGSSKIGSYTVKNLRLWNDRITMDTDPLTWTKDASNPVLTYGSSGQWDDTAVASPGYMAFDGKNYVFYTGTTAGTDKIGFATAQDLKTFNKYASNPVISPTVSTFDAASARDPDVQFRDNYLKMYYAGKGTSTGVGLAVGVDNTTWKKYDQNPVFGPSGAQWDNGQVRDPEVLRVNNTWFMYYSGNASNGGWRIGLAKSYDNGFYWVRPASNKILDVGQSGKFDDQAVRSPSIIFDKDRYLMFYIGIDTATGTGKIGLATSTDGITWTRENGGNPIISTGSGWESSHLNSVTAGVVNGKYELYYEADGGDGKVRLGHATSNTYTSATVVSEEIALPSNGVWNDVLVNKTEPSGTHINVSVLDASTGTAITGFSDLTAGQINISSIDANTYPKLKLKATFDSDGKSAPALYDWAVNWTLAKVEQKTQIPNKSFLEEGSATNLYDLSTYFTHKRFSNKTLTYTIKTNSDPVNIDAKIEADGYHMSFNAPTVNWTGSAQYTLNVYDGYMNLTSNQFTVSVLNVNDAPVWLKIPDKHITEDTPVNNLVDLTLYAVDSDTLLKDLVFTFVNHDPANMTVTLNANNRIDVSPGDNYTGTVVVTVKVSDGQYSANTSFNIIVNPVNDRPVWTPFGPIQLVEDTPQVDLLNLETFVKDAETSQSQLVYSVSADPSTIVATISNAHKLSLYPAANYTGTTNLTFNVSDGQYLVPLVVIVIVSPVNDAPHWLTTPQFTFPEDSKGGQNLVNLESYVVDAETPSKALVYNVEHVSEPSAAVTIDAKHNLSVTSGENYFGTIIIEVSASDGFLRSFTNMTVIVTPVNDPPVITSTPIRTAIATELYQYQVTALDIENNPLTFSLTSFISGMSIEATSGLITWVPTDAQTGSYEVKLRVSDGLAFATQDFFIDVSPKASGNNNPPVITSEPPTEVVLGGTYTYTVQAIDADKDPLTYSLSTRPTGMTMTSTTGVVDWVPQVGTEGVHPVVVTVSDGKVQVTQSFVITVFPKGTIINHPPVITSRPVTKIIAGSEYTYRVVATDADGDTLHYYLSSAPQNMTLDANLGTVHWTPTAQDLGEKQIVIRVTDGRANASQAYSLQVSLANHSPSMISTPETKALVGKPYKYQLTATDPDTSDKLLYGLKSGPAGMSVDPSTGLVTWTPTKASTETVTVYVTDGIVQTNQTFTVKVTTKKTTGLDLANFPWWIVVALVVVIVVIIALVLSRKRDKVEPLQARRAPPSRTHQNEHHPASPPMHSAPHSQQVPAPAPPIVTELEAVDPDQIEKEPILPEDQPLEETQEEEPPVKEESRDDILDEILGKAPPSETGTGPAKGKAVVTKTIPKASAKPADTTKKTVLIEDKSYNQEQILQTLTSLPRGLPSTLWGMDMDELASELMIAEYSHNNNGDVIVKIGKKWYFGDPKELGNYLQHDKSQGSK